MSAATGVAAQAANEGQHDAQVAALLQQVALLERRLGDLHTTDLNALKRAYASLTQHVSALALEAAPVAGAIAEFETAVWRARARRRAASEGSSTLLFVRMTRRPPARGRDASALRDDAAVMGVVGIGLLAATKLFSPSGPLRDAGPAMRLTPWALAAGALGLRTLPPQQFAEA